MCPGPKLYIRVAKAPFLDILSPLLIHSLSIIARLLKLPFELPVS